jgi:hypothetical protein
LGVNSSLSYSNVTGNISVSWVIPINETNDVCFEVVNQTGGVRALIYVSCSNVYTVLYYAVPVNVSYLANIYANASDGNIYQLQSLYVDTHQRSFVFGKDGAVIATFLILVVALMLYFNPVVMLAGVLVTLIVVSKIIPLIPIGHGALIGLIAAGMAIIIKLKT